MEYLPSVIPGNTAMRTYSREETLPSFNKRYDEIIAVDAVPVIMRARTMFHNALSFYFDSNTVVMPSECIYPSPRKTEDFDTEVLKLSNDIIEIIYRAVLSGTDRSQTGKTSHEHGITQAIDTIMYKGLSLELASTITHSLEFEIVTAISNVVPHIDSENYLETPCKGWYRDRRFILFIKYKEEMHLNPNHANNVTVNADLV